MAAIREAVGPDVDIIIENHANTDTGAAIQFAQALEPYNIYFYEEVNTPLNPELILAVKDKTAIPNFVIHEHHQKTLLDEYAQLVTPVIQPVDGYFTAPETPGIGVNFTDHVLEHSDVETVQ